MSFPVFTIIIPVYNASEHINISVNSIINQTYYNWELILVDDGSTDNSLDLCKQIALVDNRIKVIHQHNCGVSSARNSGLRVASGTFVTFVDADDWLEPNALQLYHEVIATYNPDIIKFGYIRDYYDGKQDIVVSDRVYYEISKPLMLKRINEFEYWGYVWNSVYRKEICQKLSFDEDLAWLEDHIFTLNFFRNSNSMVLIPNALYHYTINVSLSLSNNRSPQDIYIASLRSYLLNLELIESGSQDALNDSRARYHYFNNLSVRELYSGSYSYEYKNTLHELFILYDRKDTMLYEFLFSIKRLPFPFINFLLEAIFLIRKVFKKI